MWYVPHLDGSANFELSVEAAWRLDVPAQWTTLRASGREFDELGRNFAVWLVPAVQPSHVRDR